MVRNSTTETSAPYARAHANTGGSLARRAESCLARVTRRTILHALRCSRSLAHVGDRPLRYTTNDSFTGYNSSRSYAHSYTYIIATPVISIHVI